MSDESVPAKDAPTPRWLFVRTCQDILKRQRSPDYYDKLRLAGLLRHLLVGPRALLADANRDSALPLEFWYREPHADVEAHPWGGPNGFDASRRELAKGNVVRGGVDTFLAARVAHFGEWFTVQQLVEVVAHAYGGQYALRPEGVSDAAMIAVAEAAKDGPGGRLAVALHEIAGVSLRALIPLANPSGKPATGTAPRPASTPSAAGKCPFSGA